MTAKTPKVLIFEDEKEAAEMFAEMVRVSGYDVLQCYSSTSAMETINEEKPQIIVLDVMMPEVSGLDILRKLKKDAKLSKIPVILVSAKSTPTDIKTGMEAGAAFYLTKPVSFLDLKKAVEELASALEA